MKNDPLVKSIVKSCKSAFRTYSDMTEGDAWVSWTPEYWYTSYIAKGLRKHDSNYSVWLEHNLDTFKSHAIEGGKVDSDEWATLERADITLWKKHPENKWEAKSILEVKKAWSCNKKKLSGDIKRICKSIGTSPLKTGYFIIITDAKDTKRRTAKKKIKNLRKKIQKSIPVFAGKYFSNLKVETYQKKFASIIESKSIAAVIIIKFTEE